MGGKGRGVELGGAGEMSIIKIQRTHNSQRVNKRRIVKYK